MSLDSHAAPLIRRDDINERLSKGSIARQDVARFEIPCDLSRELSTAFGADVWICDATRGPTCSWKDCVAPDVVAAAREQGAQRVVVASSGNHGRAIAFACRAAGLQTAVLVYEQTPADVVASLAELDAEVFRFPDRASVHAAMDTFIAEGWFSATLTDRRRDRDSMPGGDGYRRIAASICAAVAGEPIVAVPTCYGDGAHSIYRHLVRLGRAPMMCLVRAAEGGRSVAASIATDIVTPQVSRMLAAGAIDIRVDDRSLRAGLRTIEAAVGKLLDSAEGGLPEALGRLVAMKTPILRRSIVCVITGGIVPRLDYQI